MSDYALSDLPGHLGTLVVHRWPVPTPRCRVLLLHGYGEHMGRYHPVAAMLNDLGATVFGPDHIGHGLSEGERVLMEDYDKVVDDVQLAVQQTTKKSPSLPLVVIGHSMGGLIATRYVQRYGEGVRGLILSGPLLGRNTAITNLSSLPELPDEPLDIATLSRDPAVGAAYQADPLVWHGPFKRPTLLAMKTMLTAIDNGPGFAALPTLWLHGGDDRLVKVEETRSTLDKLKGTDFDSEIYPGAQHEVFNEVNKEAVLARVQTFIERII